MIKREISIMINVNHPTIIKFIGYSQVDFHGENNITIIMELATNGSLKDVLKKIQEHDGPKSYTNTSRQMILIGVSRGMKYLHDRNIMHRDLKTDNILLDEDFHPHITDFGLSKSYEVGHSRSQTKFGGTLIYEAPEIRREEKYDKKVDVYSFGILMYEVLTDSVPYPELNGGEIAVYKFINKVITENYRPKFTVPIKKSFKDLIERCWSDDPKKRPTFCEIFNKLSNKNKDDDDDEDFLLDDVDVEELKFYVEDVTDAADFTEKLLNRISETERENQKLKTENIQQRNKIEKYEKNRIKLMDELNQTKMKYEQAKQEQRDKIEKNEKDKKKPNHDDNQIKQELNRTKKTYRQAKQELENCKRELNQSKDLSSGRKSDNKQYAQTIIVGGSYNINEFGEKPNSKDKYDKPIISPPVNLSFDFSSLLSYSTHWCHSVIVTIDGSLKGVGDNRCGHISSTFQHKIIDDFTDFCIKDCNGHKLSAVSAVCYQHGTLYMLSKNNINEKQLVLCDSYIKNGDPIFLDIGKHQPVSLFGGLQYTAAIGSEGEVIFINGFSIKKSPKSQIEASFLPDGEKASSVAICDKSVVVLSTNGRVFKSPNESNKVLNFSIVSELSGQEIVCVSGRYAHFLAVSKEGRVFVLGYNPCGELGLGEKIYSVSSFTEISSLRDYEISAAYAGNWHSLFQTRDGKILSCGSNECGELLLSNGTCEKVYLPTETTIKSGASFCIATSRHSKVFIGFGAPPNIPNMRIQQSCV